MSIEIGFLGYGKMAGAISDGLNKSGLITYEKQIITAHHQSTIDKAVSKKGVAAAADNRDLGRRCKVVVLSVKPHQMIKVLQEIKNDLSDGQLVISLAAGLKLETLRAALPEKVSLVRAMPNVAALAGCGTTLICAEPGISQEYMAKAREIFESVGVCLEINEHLFDIGSAVSGSGPAYFYMIIEAFVRGAVRLGLPYDTAKAMVLNTALGAVESARQPDSPSLSELRDMVTSPGGMTAAALHVLEINGLNGILQEALEAATDKSIEMASRKD